MILLMRQKWIYFLLGSLISFYACSSDNEPQLPLTEPMPMKPTFNKADSLALVEIYRQGDGNNWYSQWDLTDIRTWGGTGWALDTEKNEYRLVKLFMTANNTGNGTISPRIGDLEYLTEFEASGKTFRGEVPETITKLKYLKYFDLTYTLVLKIPDDMFNENFTYVYIGENKKLSGSLPSSLVKLKGGEYSNPSKHFRIVYNAYTGAIPIVEAEISFEGNNLTYYPFEIAGKSKIGEYNVWAAHNRLSGTIPEEILKDTLRIYHFSRQASLQQNGYGYSNMPSDEEISKMMEEYEKNHPEYKN